LKYLIGLAAVLLLAGCASGRGGRYKVPEALHPDIDAEERNFFYGSFFKRAGT
jgi:hypothetical protein